MHTYMCIYVYAASSPVPCQVAAHAAVEKRKMGRPLGTFHSRAPSSDPARPTIRSAASLRGSPRWARILMKKVGKPFRTRAHTRCPTCNVEIHMHAPGQTAAAPPSGAADGTSSVASGAVFGRARVSDLSPEKSIPVARNILRHCLPHV